MELNTLDKLKDVRDDVLELFKNLSLFVVIKRVDINLWDFVFAAPRLDQPENLKPIAEIVRKRLDKSEIVNISRLVLLNTDAPFVKDFNLAFSVGDKNGYTTIKDSQINNIQIKEAYLYLSRR